MCPQVQELCKPHLFLPAGKVEQLYAALRQKDAQIYVQRCRAAPPPRTRLVACCLSALRVLALADPAVHGAARAQARLRHLDRDSPWPEEGIDFTTLWCRGVSVQCAQWQLRLRDFPQPLLSMAHLRLWGTLLAAEEQPPPRGVHTTDTVFRLMHYCCYIAIVVQRCARCASSRARRGARWSWSAA